jgi:hypothetical protein
MGVGAGLDLFRFPLHEIGISGKREMLAIVRARRPRPVTAPVRCSGLDDPKLPGLWTKSRAP